MKAGRWKRGIGAVLTGILAVSAAGCAFSRESGADQGVVVHEETVVIPKLEEEFEILFLADTHISLCDDRDPELLEKAKARYEGFREESGGTGADESFRELMAYVKEEQPDLLILGGDIVDSAMWASIDLVQEQLEALDVPWVYGMGNHDFEYGGEYYTERAYAEYLPRLSGVSDTRDGFQVMEYDRFVVLVTDDQCNRISEEAAEKMEQLSEGEKPVIVVTHVPVEPSGDDSLWEETKKVWGETEDGRSRVLLGPNSCRPDETTQRFLDAVLREDGRTALVLAGHIHFYHRDDLTENLVQVVTGAGFEREIVKVTLTP